jgi:hypothetical protein
MFIPLKNQFLTSLREVLSFNAGTRVLSGLAYLKGGKNQ